MSYNSDYRVDINEAMMLDLFPREILVDTYLYQDIDSAFSDFILYEDRLERLCKENNNVYFLEIDIDVDDVTVSYIYYEGKY